MPLPPSRRDSAGPPPKHVGDLSALVRHLRSNARGIDPGFLDGTRATPQLVGAEKSQLVGEDTSGGDTSTDQILFCNTDQYLLAGRGDQVFQLSHVPIESSLQVFWLPMRASVDNWALSDDSLSVPDPGWRGNDMVEVAYAYEYDGEPEPSDVVLDFGTALEWRFFQTTTHDGSILYADPAYDDSGWAIVPAPFGETTPPHDGVLGDYVTIWNQGTRMWARIDVAAEPGIDILLKARWNRTLRVWWNGSMVSAGYTQVGNDILLVTTVPGSDVLASNLLAVQVTDDQWTGPHTGCYFDMGAFQSSAESPL